MVSTLARKKMSAAVRKRIKELHEALSAIDEDKMKVIRRTIENAAYMEEKLDEIKEQLEEVGFVEEYQNGENQWGTKESTVSKAYNMVLKNYNTYIRTLLSAMPESAGMDGDDGFEEFLGSLKK